MSKDNFQWTDESVLEFARFTNCLSPAFQGRYADLEQFKSSHTPKEQEAEYYGKEFGNEFEQLVFWATHSGWRYCQKGEKCGNEPILKLSHFNEMVKRIMKRSTPKEQTIDKDGKDWEIVEFEVPFLGFDKVKFTRGYDRLYATGLNGQIYSFREDFLLSNKGVITCVKRLSDGEALSVGGDTDVGKIKSFEIVDSLMYVRCTNNNVFPLVSIQKSKPEKERVRVALFERGGTSAGDIKFEIYIDKPIPGYKHSAIKEAVEKVLNDDYAIGVDPYSKEGQESKATVFKKVAEYKSRPVLFTTEDGVDVYEGQEFVVVDSDFKKSIIDRATGKLAPTMWPKYKFFGNSEKAEEYITQNKPLNLSMKEIASCVTDYLYNPKPGVYERKSTVIDLDKLDRLIKSKLDEK